MLVLADLLGRRATSGVSCTLKSATAARYFKLLILHSCLKCSLEEDLGILQSAGSQQNGRGFGRTLPCVPLAWQQRVL